jgi:hypothetical protein
VVTKWSQILGLRGPDERERSERGGRVCSLPVEHRRVGTSGESLVCVAETAAHHVERRAGELEQGGVRVAEPVRCEPGYTGDRDQPLHPGAYRVGMQW